MKIAHLAQKKSRFISFVLLLTSACASIPASDPGGASDAPESSRPYLVPVGRAAWRTTVSWGSAPESSLAAFPWEWEQRIGSWSLVWKPIPFEARFSVEESAERSVGLRLNILGDPYYRSGDFNWSPLVELDWRERTTDTHGLRSTLLLNPEVRRSGDPFNFTFELQSGPYLQLGRSVWVQAHAAIRAESGSPIARYLGSPPPMTTQSSSDLRWRLPLGVAIKVNIPGAFGLSHGSWGLDGTWYHLGFDRFSSVQLLSTLSWQFGS